MFTWIGEQGLKADIGALRQEHPTMMTFAALARSFGKHQELGYRNLTDDRVLALPRGSA